MPVPRARHLTLTFLQWLAPSLHTVLLVYRPTFLAHAQSDYAAFLILLSSLNSQGFVFSMYLPAEAMSVPERVRYYNRSVVLMDRLAAM